MTMSDDNALGNCLEGSRKLQSEGRFTVDQLLKARMVKSAFSIGNRIEHFWVKVSEVQVENRLVKGKLEHGHVQITHLTVGATVFVPFKDVEDVWIEGKVPESLKSALESTKQEDAWMFISWVL